MTRLMSCTMITWKSLATSFNAPPRMLASPNPSVNESTSAVITLITGGIEMLK